MKKAFKGGAEGTDVMSDGYYNTVNESGAGSPAAMNVPGPMYLKEGTMEENLSEQGDEGGATTPPGYGETPTFKEKEIDKDPKIATEELDEVIVTANSPETIESNVKSNEKNALFGGGASEKKIAQGANTPKALKKEVSDQDWRIHKNRRGESR